VDNSILEVYVNGGRAVVTSRMYPLSMGTLIHDLITIEKKGKGCGVEVENLSVWNMKSIFKEGYLG